MFKFDLAGTWSLRSADKKIETSITLPGDIYTALAEAEIIPHPYKGRNELETQWVHKLDWILEREVELPTLQEGLQFFHAEVLDTVARVEINGRMIGESDNMFIPALFSTMGALKPGKNLIRIFIDSAENTALARARAYPYPVPATPAPVYSPSRNFLRKVQCHGGWDWGPCIMTGGAYRSLGITASETRIRNLSYDLEQIKDRNEWKVRIRGTILSGRQQNAELKISLADVVLKESLSLSAGECKLDRSLTIASPELWWPAGEGDQPLYPLEVSLGDWKDSLRVGFRTVEVVCEKDERGKSMFFRVNGREIFAKGSNWIPTDALPSGEQDKKVRHLLDSAVKAHMNMIRVWGGGQYESEFFYKLCDELGLLIWQDFMFSCSLYPTDRAFLDSVDKEVREQIPRLKSHPCLALFCGNNEDLGALTWYEESKKNRDVYLVDYDRLNEGVVGKAVRETAPGHCWWPSSPSAGEGDYSDCWHDDSQGDMHYWSVWHEGKPFESYYEILPRFCSEFGFQSFPSFNTVKDYADEDQWNVTSPVMMHHQKNERGNEIIISTLSRYYRFPESFKDFLYLSQVQQARAIQTAVEYWRGNRPVCMGALYWQLNDNWPVASWSSIDYAGEWKLLHFEAARFFRPLHIAGWIKDQNLTVKAMNDHHQSRKAEAVVNFRRFNGEITRSLKRDLTLSPASVQTVLEEELTAQTDCQNEFVELILTSGGREYRNIVFLDVPRMCRLADADVFMELSGTEDRRIISLSSSLPAFHIYLTGAKGDSFSDNGFHLMPGETRQIEWDSPFPGASPPELTHLRKSY